MDKSSSLGMSMSPPRNIQEVQASKLGDASEAPPSSSAKIRSPFNTLYFYCFMHYAFFLERQLFCFQFYFALFAAINVGSHHVLERAMLHFSFPRTLHFSLLSFQQVFSFSDTAFSFSFLP
jgi:hypothetical protein